MAKRKRSTDLQTIAKRLKEGRGDGRGASYQPWLQIQDVPFQGLASRIKGWKTGREHHLMSNLESSYREHVTFASLTLIPQPLLPRVATQYTQVPI
jgi:hypothetical protein